MLEHGTRGRGNKLGDLALAASGDTRDPAHKLVCWGAVVHLLREASIIGSSRKYDAVGANNWEALFPKGCPDVGSRAECRAVPRGSILGFFKWNADNQLYLAHAAIALANCKVAGTNGRGVGLPDSLQQIGDMAGFDWGSGRSGSSYSIMDGGHRVSILLVYRDVDGIGMPSTCAVM